MESYTKLLDACKSTVVKRPSLVTRNNEVLVNQARFQQSMNTDPTAIVVIFESGCRFKPVVFLATFRVLVVNQVV